MGRPFMFRGCKTISRISWLASLLITAQPGHLSQPIIPMPAPTSPSSPCEDKMYMFHTIIHKLHMSLIHMMAEQHLQKSRSTKMLNSAGHWAAAEQSRRMAVFTFLGMDMNKTAEPKAM